MSHSLRRLRNILDFALASLLRRKGKNLSLLGVYTLVVFTTASLVFFVHALKQEAALILEQAPDMVVQRLTAGRQDLIPIDRAQTISAIRGVRSVEPRTWGYYYDPLSGANFTVIVDGTAGEPVTLGSGVARTLRLAEGDMFPLRSATGNPTLLAVGKILSADSELVSADLIIVSPATFHSLFDYPQDRATDLAVRAGNPRELPIIATKIVQLFPDARPILKSEILRTYQAIFDWRSGMMIVVLAAATLAFAITAWDKATGLSADERREIGILKSIGWDTPDVLLLKFWEGAAVSFTAALTGILLAYVHVFFFSATLFDHALRGWSVLYPSYHLVPAVDAYQLSVIFFLTVVPYTVATIVPCWRAASSDPDAAMRT